MACRINHRAQDEAAAAGRQAQRGEGKPPDRCLEDLSGDSFDFEDDCTLWTAQPAQWEQKTLETAGHRIEDAGNEADDEEMKMGRCGKDG